MQEYKEVLQYILEEAPEAAKWTAVVKKGCTTRWNNMKEASVKSRQLKRSNTPKSTSTAAGTSSICQYADLPP
jgi:hypothetical protein